MKLEMSEDMFGESDGKLNKKTTYLEPLPIACQDRRAGCVGVARSKHRFRLGEWRTCQIEACGVANMTESEVRHEWL